MYGLIFLFAVTAATCDAYKILVVFPYPARSHSILGDGVVNALAKADNLYDTLSKKHENKVLFPDHTHYHMDNLLNKTQMSIDLSSLVTVFSELFNKTILNKDVQALINDPKENYDVIIIEWIFYDVFSGLAAVFNCPYIWVSSVDPHWRILSLVDDLSNPAYTPDMLSSNMPPFTFMQRTKELAMQILGLGLQNILLRPAQRRDYKKLLVPAIQKRRFPVPQLDDVIYNASLVLSNSHPSIGKATRLPQNFIPVGGYHIERDVKPLSEEFKKILDSAKNGLIYFSLGSNVKSKYLPEQIKKDLLKMFSGLKQTVLWKFEEQLASAPPNVHFVEWAPQNSILAHPNCILFLNHGGLLSTIETVHFGKPMVAVPIFGDQFNNAQRAVEKGFALQVDMSYNVANDIKVAIDEILDNPSYTKRAKELSMIYHDRPVTPDKELVHWVEHVVKTQGAQHLRSPALNVSWYQKLYLDLAAILLTMTIVFTIALRVVITWFMAYCKNDIMKSDKKTQ